MWVVTFELARRILEFQLNSADNRILDDGEKVKFGTFNIFTTGKVKLIKQWQHEFFINLRNDIVRNQLKGLSVS